MRLQLELRPGTRIANVSSESLMQFPHAIAELRIGSNLCQPQIGNLIQQQARVLLTLLPEIWIQIAKDLQAIRRPAPPIIPRELFERLQCCRQFANMQSR